MNKPLKGNQAIVIGSSMAGLITARVLADHFRQVILLEKDETDDEPKPRKGVPQGHHLHGLLAQGRTLLETFYPGLGDELIADGAITGDMGESMRWYHFGGYKKKFSSGLKGLLMSRPLLEIHVRRRTVQLPNVTLRMGCQVRELMTDVTGQRVTGVRLETLGQEVIRRESLEADLIVDASGRGSASLRWLTALGYHKPPEEEVKIGLSYATRLYRREVDPLGQVELIMVAPEPPHDKRGCFAFPIEDNRWIVTMSGILHESCPKDPDAFLDFTKSLCAPDIYELLQTSEPLSDIVLYKFPCSLRRHYEQLKAFPDRYLVVGDAVCSFNPIFGQGMTSAVLQAQTLDRCLQNSKTLDGLWKPYFKAIAKVVDSPWQAATGEDFRYPEAEGQRPPGFELLNRYTEAVHRATQRDTVVYKAFLEVMNLMRPPQSLMRPTIFWRVMKDKMLHQRQSKNRREGIAETVSAPA
ncbi:FAD-dependent monooxygenase [Spirosoma taeanense]|uniref:FAD-dependent monooxygenase n=1 Tax=Spirosoma taeanense TaxID=2735870 RepID=A0A6M5YA33_9BACT|nr:FAD-dependent monooxygenase [Spirosoma taeanense]QJW90849.1 FAD-dependent monooxygenase [Spirosoma taeanense]